MKEGAINSGIPWRRTCEGSRRTAMRALPASSVAVTALGGDELVAVASVAAGPWISMTSTPASSLAARERTGELGGGAAATGRRRSARSSSWPARAAR